MRTLNSSPCAAQPRPRRPAQPGLHPRQAGFSLVELMVANVIGLVVAIAVVASVLTIGRGMTSVSSSVSAQANVQVALAAINQAGSVAGVGLYSDGKLMCPTWNAWSGTAIVANGTSLMPARIIDGGSASASDRIVFTGGGAMGAMPAMPVYVPTNGANIKLGQHDRLENGDIALIGVPGSTTVPCTLFQVTQAPGPTSGCGAHATTCNLVVRTANQGINPPPNTFTDITYGFAEGESVDVRGPAVVVRLGKAAEFRQEAFAVQCNALVRYNAFTGVNPPACTQVPLGFGTGVEAIAGDVVMMQAQYGVSATAASDVVTEWVEPSGTWGGNLAQARTERIKALRLVLVSRAPLPEGEEVSKPCTNRKGVVNVGPCSFHDVNAPVIDLSATSVQAGRSWKNYRYRVLKAVIPLRAVLWSTPP